MRNLVLLIIGTLLGGLSTFGLLRFVQVEHAGPRPVSADTASPFKVTLYRFELKPDSLGKFDEWVKFEHAHQDETVATLSREKMYFEAIFRDRVRQKDVIYWLAIQGEGGATTQTSPLAVDKEYEHFMQQTLKPGSRTTLSTEYFLTPDFVVDAIRQNGR